MKCSGGTSRGYSLCSDASDLGIVGVAGLSAVVLVERLLRNSQESVVEFKGVSPKCANDLEIQPKKFANMIFL